MEESPPNDIGGRCEIENQNVKCVVLCWWIWAVIGCEDIQILFIAMASFGGIGVIGLELKVG